MVSCHGNTNSSTAGHQLGQRVEDSRWSQDGGRTDGRTEHGCTGRQVSTYIIKEIKTTIMINDQIRL